MRAPAPRIVSASRRTDLPAFYSQWFARRLRAGWCRAANPFSGKAYRVSLAPADVLGWVFWSRDYGRFLDILRSIHDGGGRFLCHFTINGMPRVLEPRTIEPAMAVEQARALSQHFGTSVPIWRYDPILLSSATPPDWHRRNFAQIAEALRGVVDRCIFSFPTMYGKTRRNLVRAEEQAASEGDAFRVWRAGFDFGEADLRALACDLASLARERGVEMQTCCGEKWVDPGVGIASASCVDWPRLAALGAGGGCDMLGEPRVAVARKGSRAACGCWQSVDIGAYGSCAHGCVYCYAVESAEAARVRVAKHDAHVESL